MKKRMDDKKNRWMMHRKGVAVGFVMLAMMALLSGCSLAVEGAGEEETNQDRLIGVFITRESISSFDAEAYMEEHLEELINGKEITMEDYSAYDDRIYADINKNDSEDPGEWEFSFGNLEGIQFFDGLYQIGDNEPFTMVTADDGICDIHTGYHSSDEGNTVTAKGTVYVPITSEEIILYSNPVYQTPEGEIYTIPAAGNGFGSASIGTSMTETLTNEVKVTEDGKTEMDTSIVEITYEMSYEPLRIWIHQMDEHNQIIKTEEYAPGALPETMNAEKETSYIIVETEWNNWEKEDDRSRELFEKVDGEYIYIESMYAVEGEVLCKQSTEVMWGK